MNQDIPDFLYEEQMEHEVGAVQRGIHKYHKDILATPPANRSPEMKYIQRSMDSLTEHIRSLQVRVARGDRMVRVRRWGMPIISLDAEVLSLITITSIFNLPDQTVPRIARDIAERVVMEIAAETVKLKDRGVMQWLERNYSHGMRSHTKAALMKRAQDLIDGDWDEIQHQAVGACLLTCAVESVPDIEKGWTYTKGGKRAQTVRLTDQVRADIEKQHEDLSVLSPVLYPMVCPPRDWTTCYDGGYLIGTDKWSCIYPLVDTGIKNHIPDYEPEMFGLNREGINWIQQTRWAVNQDIAGVMQDIDILDSPLGKKLATQPRDVPDRGDVDWDDPDSVKSWKLKAYDVHQHNRNTVGQRSLHFYLQDVAKKMGKYDQFWFTWKLDFRGRYNPVFCGMDPHGDKINKAYLKFAEALPLTDEGFKALTIHLGNCMGYDKAPLDERIQAVYEREEEIRSWVEDPLRNQSWVEEETVMSLAAAHEWVRAVDSGDPGSYRSGLPIGIDGKCNGLQHLSALARDPVGAWATCLVPDDVPQDIYTLVQKKVDEYVENTIRQANFDQIPTDLPEAVQAGVQGSMSGEERERRKRQQEFFAARMWHGETSRSLVKRGAMTWAYGVTRQGIMTQLISDGFLDGLDGPLSVNAAYMRDAIYASVNETVTSARMVMEWLQSVAAIAFDAGQALSWTSPSGMAVHQEYLKPAVTDMNLVTGRYQFYVKDLKKRKLLKQRQLNGIAPNFVHSIDAAHMTAVLLRLKEEGIRDTHMIHDSYGVHACHIPRLHQIVREEFVKIHKRNLLQEFKDEVEERLGLTLPDYPELGTFDVTQVLDSQYAFT